MQRNAGVSPVDIEAEMMRRDLKQFLVGAWETIESPSTPFFDNWHIDAICQHLQACSGIDPVTGEAGASRIRNLIINIPPRMLKSTICAVVWPCWEWITLPWTRWLTASYSERLSTRDSVKRRRLLMSDWYQRRWGPGSLWAASHSNRVFKLLGDQNEKMRFENDRFGYMIATSVGGTATGDGGDRLLLDDPNNMDDIDSETIRTGTNQWIDDVWSSRGNDPKTVVNVVIQQRGHEDDVSGHLLKQGGWEHLVFPMQYEEIAA